MSRHPRLQGKDSAEKAELRKTALERLGIPPPTRGRSQKELDRLMPWVQRHFGENPTAEDMATPEWPTILRQHIFLQGIVHYFTPAAACLHCGARWPNIKKWLAEDEVFKEWVHDAQRFAVELVETGLFASAVNGKTDSYVFLQARMNDVYKYNKDGGASAAPVQVVIVNQLPDGTLRPTEGNRIIEAPKVEVLQSGQ